MHARTGHRDLPAETAEEAGDAHADRYVSPLAVWMTRLPVTETARPWNDMIFSWPATIEPMMSALNLPVNTSLIKDQVMITDGGCDVAEVIVDAAGSPGTLTPR